ncbi:hypothetical protein KGF54_005606 [Candida jiufengensis]|uniref:uncharacterized protein n=1 Tax=Candida jiufengensis TaxID=497108 RepID=UPI0022252245|nr:uncharacterized protein KGF54_005606 [Candida jiufengensis]KAI5949371.1 hypothetical protein KGF54_005606 [Candida jiufengensis]
MRNMSSLAETTPNTQLDLLLSKFEDLKSKRQETIRLNKLEVSKDLRQQELSYARSNNGSVGSTLDLRDDLSEKEKLMEYTIKECERWHEKQQRKANTGIQDQNKLAESSYYKEINAIEIDKDAYRLQKELQSEGASNVTSKSTKEEMSRLMKESKDRKFNKKKRERLDDDEDVGNYINEKNKQFNMKLNRQYQ